MGRSRALPGVSNHGVGLRYVVGETVYRIFAHGRIDACLQVEGKQLARGFVGIRRHGAGEQ
jgi:hypothetical protein